MTRIADLRVEDLSTEQREAYAEVAGSRGGVARGPFGVWLRRPGLAVAASRFGDALRLHGELDRRSFELITLVVAAHWHADYPWAVHESAAVDAGLDPAVVEAIRLGTTPVFANTHDELVYDIGVEVLATGTLADASYENALTVLGVDLLSEVVTIYGWYTVAALITNVFEVEVPGRRRRFPARTGEGAPCGSGSSGPATSTLHSRNASPRPT